MNKSGTAIVEAQNSQRQLMRLAAQRVAYSRAKGIWGICSVASLAAPLLALLTLRWPALKPYIALYGGLVAVLDSVVMDALWRAQIRQGANIQEDFDCEVLQLPRNPLKGESVTEPEAVHFLAQEYRKKHPGFEKLTNWYSPTVGELPLNLARLVCQRENVWWDGELRRRYAASLWAAAVAALVVVSVVGFCIQASFQDVVMVCVFPVVPAILWCAKEFKKQRDMAADGEKLRLFIEKRWAVLSAPNADPSALERESRLVQDAIYERRRSASPVFDWIYELWKRGQEKQASYGAEELVGLWKKDQSRG